LLNYEVVGLAPDFFVANIKFVDEMFVAELMHGCQIFLGTIYQKGEK
jgi:hypothetical protein